jgi:hypothetical protein
MTKIGRNEPCACGSGLKYKKCCLHTKKQDPIVPQTTSGNGKVTVRQAIDDIARDALNKLEKIKVLGVFVLFSTNTGDAWLLEVTDKDAIRLADKGKFCTIELDENPETIMINWSHKFSSTNKKFITTAYRNKRKAEYENYPVAKINNAIKKVKEKLSPEILKELHVATELDK